MYTFLDLSLPSPFPSRPLVLPVLYFPPSIVSFYHIHLVHLTSFLLPFTLSFLPSFSYPYLYFSSPPFLFLFISLPSFSFSYLLFSIHLSSYTCFVWCVFTTFFAAWFSLLSFASFLSVFALLPPISSSLAPLLYLLTLIYLYLSTYPFAIHKFFLYFFHPFLFDYPFSPLSSYASLLSSLPPALSLRFPLARSLSLVPHHISLILTLDS